MWALPIMCSTWLRRQAPTLARRDVPAVSVASLMSVMLTVLPCGPRVHDLAHEVEEQDVELLDPGGRVGGGGHDEVRMGRRRTAGPPGEQHGRRTGRASGRETRDDVGRAPARGEPDDDVARPRERRDLAREDVVVG